MFLPALLTYLTHKYSAVRGKKYNSRESGHILIKGLWQTLSTELTTTIAVAVSSAEDKHTHAHVHACMHTHTHICTHTNATCKTHHYYCARCIKCRPKYTSRLGCWSLSKFKINFIIVITIINSSSRITVSALGQLIIIQEIIPVFVHATVGVHKLVWTDFQFILMKYFLILNQHTVYWRLLMG